MYMYMSCAYLLDLSQLFAASSHIVIANLIEGLLLVFSLDWLSLAVYDSVRCHDAVGAGVSLDYLELHLPHPSSYQQYVTCTRTHTHIFTQHTALHVSLAKSKAVSRPIR